MNLVPTAELLVLKLKRRAGMEGGKDIFNGEII